MSFSSKVFFILSTSICLLGAILLELLKLLLLLPYKLLFSLNDFFFQLISLNDGNELLILFELVDKFILLFIPLKSLLPS